MAGVKNLTPKLRLYPSEEELQFPSTDRPMGERVGGLEMYSNAFKRGYGDAVFGSDNNGIWLGAAEFADAPFSVDMDGNMVASSATFSQYISKTGSSQSMTGSINIKDSKIVLDGSNGRILVTDGTNNRIVIGNV